MWIYGRNPVVQALLGERRVVALYVYTGRSVRDDEVERAALKRNIEIKRISDHLFFDSRFPKGHQGIAAEIADSKKPASLDEMLRPGDKGVHRLFIVLDGVQDPRNLGAIMRTAEAAGACGMVIQEHRSAKPSAVVYKTSSGASEHLPLCILPNIKHALKRFKDEGYLIIGAEAGGNVNPWDVDMACNLVIIIGGEDKGIRKTVKDMCDEVVSLPIRGRVNSLNASVAAGILIYEHLRQNS